MYSLLRIAAIFLETAFHFHSECVCCDSISEISTEFFIAFARLSERSHYVFECEYFSHIRRLDLVSILSTLLLNKYPMPSFYLKKLTSLKSS